MKIAIATDQDFVSAHFGCSPAFTIVDVEGGQILNSLTIPNPGCQHAFWADLFCRNSVRHVIAGAMGANAQAVIRGCGVDVIVGVQGRLDDVVRRFTAGTLAPGPACAVEFCSCQKTD